MIEPWDNSRWSWKRVLTSSKGLETIAAIALAVPPKAISRRRFFFGAGGAAVVVGDVVGVVCCCWSCSLRDGVVVAIREDSC